MAISFPKRRKDNCHVPKARKLCSLSLAYSSGIPGSSKDEGTYCGREQNIDYVPRHIINNHGDCNPAIVAEGVLQTPDEALGRLPPDRHDIVLARSIQTENKQTRPN